MTHNNNNLINDIPLKLDMTEPCLCVFLELTMAFDIGVPQGTTLGTTLFLISVNKLFKISTY